MKKQFIILFFLLVSVIGAKAQTPKANYNQPTIEFNITDISLFEERVFFIYNLVNDGRFDVKTSENDGVFLINADEAFEGINLQESFNDFRQQNAIEFAKMDKEQAAEVAYDYKSRMSDELYLSLMMDVYIRSRQNNTCANADPFCTDNGLYQFPAGVGAGSGESGPDYNCLYTTPNPAWYYMRIGNPAGSISIYMYSTPSHDIDFCCWGPFDDPVTPCPNGLTSDKVVSCSYSSSSTETCQIPASAQTGDYFILIITNYSNQACNISFSKTGGTGVTDCGILPPLVNNSGPYCTGETIYLTANGQAGSSYHWTGPGNWSSNLQNPTRTNATVAMSGTYTCTITLNGQTNSATTEVVVNQRPTANFTYTSVCQGTATQFNATTSGNPSNTSYSWIFGDGQTGNGASISHTYANAGSYQVTLTAQTPGTTCSNTKTYTVTVYDMPSPIASASPMVVQYNGTSNLSVQAGSGTFNYHWEPANKVTNPNLPSTSTVGLTETTTFTVTVTNPQSNACSAQASITVSMEGSNMSANVTADPAELCEGNTTTLHANVSAGTGTYTFSWDHANTLNNPNIQNPIATPPVGTTTYTCHISDGITGLDRSVTITVHPNEEQTIEQTVCPGQTVEFYGQYVSEPGSYQHMDQTAFGCDKLITLNLTNYDTYETPITRHFCQGESFDFNGQHLTSPGVYRDTLSSIHGCDSIIKLNLIMDQSYNYDLDEGQFCPGSYYNFGGEHITSPGYYTHELQTAAGCDSIVHVNVILSDYETDPHIVKRCASHGPFYWETTGETFTEPNHYSRCDTVDGPHCPIIRSLELDIYENIIDTITIDRSCDSYTWDDDEIGAHYVFPLDLNNPRHIQTHNYIGYHEGCNCDNARTLVVDVWPSKELDTIIAEQYSCDKFYWDPEDKPYEDYTYNGVPINDDTLRLSGTYSRKYFTSKVCDSIVRVHIDMEYTPAPNSIQPKVWNTPAPHWVIPATEFQINTYHYKVVESNPNCSWTNVEWTCEGADNWIVKKEDENNAHPEKSSFVSVTVLDKVTDTVWLTAHIRNRCNDAIETKYFLVCSFYDIEDQYVSPIDFSVVPNPNNGQMTLNFENFSGNVNVKVYDMSGNLIDNFQTHKEIVANSMTYNMKRCAPGIYFFVANGKEGTIAKKVIISR